MLTLGVPDMILAVLRPALPLALVLLMGFGPCETEAQTPPAAPPPGPAAPAGGTQPKPAARRAPSAAVRPTLTVEVTDPAGAAVPSVSVHVDGAVERSGRTGEDGVVRFTGLRSGAYRLRFEREGFVRLERDVTLSTRQATVDVVLTPAPPPPAAPPAPPPTTTAPAEAPRSVGEPTALEVPAFVEQNLLGREPQKTSVVGCTGYATSRVLQVRDPLRDQRREDADETLYVVAGEADLNMAGRAGVIEAGTLVVVPRGTTYSLSRKGRNPVVLLSVVSGPPCPGAK